MSAPADPPAAASPASAAVAPGEAAPGAAAAAPGAAAAAPAAPDGDPAPASPPDNTKLHHGLSGGCACCLTADSSDSGAALLPPSHPGPETPTLLPGATAASPAVLKPDSPDSPAEKKPLLHGLQREEEEEEEEEEPAYDVEKLVGSRWNVARSRQEWHVKWKGYGEQVAALAPPGPWSLRRAQPASSHDNQCCDKFNELRLVGVALGLVSGMLRRWTPGSGEHLVRFGHAD